MLYSFQISVLIIILFQLEVPHHQRRLDDIMTSLLYLIEFQNSEILLFTEKLSYWENTVFIIRYYVIDRE